MSRDSLSWPVIFDLVELKGFIDEIPRKNNSRIGGPPFVYGIIAELDAEMAQYLLDHRPMNQRGAQIKPIGRIKKDLWAHNYKILGDPFHLNEIGETINGQHRCEATVQVWGEFDRKIKEDPNTRPPQRLAWVPVIVLTDDARAIEFIDSCMTVRGDAAIRKIMGAQALQQSSISGIITEHFDFVRLYISKPDRFRLCQESGMEDFAGGLHKLNRRYARSGLIAGAIRCARVNYDDAWTFFSHAVENRQVIDGKESNEARLLYNFLDKVYQQGEGHGAHGYVAVLEAASKAIFAWNSWRAGRQITQLTWFKDKPIPNPAVIKRLGDQELRLPIVGMSAKTNSKA